MDVPLIDVLNFFATPFLTCLILAGIHCYLGFHVLERGVIFVDLSLAQIAALGSTLALLVGFEKDSASSYFIALGCTFAAAWVFTLGRRYEKTLPQEGLIGVTYALGSAAVILSVNSLAHGSEHVKSLLVGQILWVQWSDVLTVTMIYSVIALIHIKFKKQFFAASQGKLGSKQGLWDFIFYALFGIVITSSVKIAGVLQVFSYLIVPSLVTNMCLAGKSLKLRLISGWILSFILSLIGLIWSYTQDLPTGATIVVCFTLIPIIGVFLLTIRQKLKSTRQV